jgi:putative transposase
VREAFPVSERHVCELFGLAVSSFRYRCRRGDEPLKEKLMALAREKPRFGYRRLHILLRREGETVNHMV